MINTSEVRYFACMWFVPMTPTKDFMSLLYQRHDGRWEMKYRFRYYTDDSPNGADDEKHWYEMGFSDAESMEMAADIEAKFDDVVRAMFGEQGVVDKISIRGDVVKFIEVMAKQGWAHFESSPSADAPS